ncbi:MAG: UDP-N-acetylglucosamine--N-acetylmuramyl-(pentapeptide) pyrophosphoryl-undecaprenol N-acetylglucosamine transferase [Patescibacteria group bacterium]|nr:UDP-N-acetylglucosamine--N-acetylmuramyl-(pentapeptide) pyrophosphoryl-undecaprenol N-acetylglucosamine transferase [Patescibacteria group bacterium]
MKKKKVVFTGGHHTSAVAVIDELKKSQGLADKVQIYFIGHRYSMHQEEIRSAEYCEIRGRGIPFYNLHAGKLYKTVNLWEWLKVPYGFVQALCILLRLRPSLIFSFGGYLAAPVVFAGWVLGIPSVTHEQTVVAGWANKFAARFAEKIFISWPQSGKFFPRKKVTFTGLPLREEIVALAQSSAWKSSPREDPVLYITGGKQGSQVINQTVANCLEDLLSQFFIYHQTGFLDFAEFKKRAEKLPPGLEGRYMVSDYYSEKEVAEIYKKAMVVVGRAGAHTTYELAALGKPAVLVPIPWASHNEQEKNARLLEQVGLARVLPQDKLNKERLLQLCLKQASLDEARLKEIRDNSRKLVRLDAAQKIVDELREYLG